MRINGELSVFIGALLIWMGAFRTGCEAIIAGGAGDWTRCVFLTVATVGAISIGFRVWRAA